MTDMAALLSSLRERDIRLSVEGDRLKCSAPPGALDAETKRVLSDRKQELITYLRQAKSLKALPRSVVPIKAEGSCLPLFVVSGHGGDVYWMLALARRLGADQPVYGIQPPGLNGSKPLDSVEELGAYELEQIRIVRPKGPYLIAGHCAGGTLAFEIAQQLTAMGEKVAFLGLIGCPYPAQFRQSVQLPLRIGRHVKALTTGSLSDRWRYLSDKIRRRSRGEPGDVADPTAADTAARARVEAATMGAVKQYEPRRYPGELDLFVTLDAWHRPDLWGKVCTGMIKHNLQYIDIDDFLLGGHVEILATALRERLRDVQGRLGAAGIDR